MKFLLRYIVTVVCICVAINVSAQHCNTIIMPDTLYGCDPQGRVQINATIARPYSHFRWVPTQGLSDTTILNPLATVGVNPITYKLIVYTLDTSIVVNGDFSKGNVGFTTPGYYQNCNLYSSPGQMCLLSNLNSKLPNTGATDHTSGTGLMLYLDAISTVPAPSWQETLTVMPNTNYQVEAWIHNAYPNGDPNDSDIIQLGMSNVAIPGTRIVVYQQPYTWKSTSGVWNSGSNTSITFQVINLNPAFGGNDYALDDISMKALCIDTASVYIGPCKPQIFNGDGSILTTTYCFEDVNHPIKGVPGGGTFTGCGIVDIGGQWYFNPALAAAGATTYPHMCNIRYQLPMGQDSVATMIVNKAESVDAGEDRVTCDGKFELAAKVIGNSNDYNFNWVPTTGLIDASKAVTLGAINNNSQQYYVNIQNKTTGCQAIDSITIFHDQFDATIVLDKDTLCALTGLTASAMINPEKLVSYNWNMGDGATSVATTVQHTYNKVGGYTIQLITRDAYCNDTTLRPIYVTDFKLSLEASSEIVEKDAFVTLQTSGSEPYHILQWRPAELFNEQKVQSQTFVPQISGAEYIVIGASDRFGCIDSARTEVRINSIVYIPNAFTPNCDGKNDYFHPVGTGEPFKVNAFAIYDRWGKQVFNGYGATAIKGWDGIYNGQPAEIGTYFYTIEVEKYSGSIISQKGDVTLIR